MSEDTKFPYWAFERTSQSIVKVVRIEGKLAILEGGGKAWLEALSQPEWIKDAVQEMAEWESEMETRKAVREEQEQDVPLWDRPEAYGERGRSKLFKS